MYKSSSNNVKMIVIYDIAFSVHLLPFTNICWLQHKSSSTAISNNSTQEAPKCLIQIYADSALPDYISDICAGKGNCQRKLLTCTIRTKFGHDVSKYTSINALHLCFCLGTNRIHSAKGQKETYQKALRYRTTI